MHFTGLCPFATQTDKKKIELHDRLVQNACRLKQHLQADDNSMSLSAMSGKKDAQRFRDDFCDEWSK
jgi:hypothetical protein